jgi:hydrogenase maturation protein HypF
MAFSWLRAAFGESWGDLRIPCIQGVPEPVQKTLDAALNQEVNCPRTSSMGRLFDAVTSLLDIRQVSSYEGQGAMELEHLASQEPRGIPLPYEIRTADPDSASGYPILTGTMAGLKTPPITHLQKKLILDMRPAVREMVARIQNGVSPARLARDFHETLLDAFLALALQIRRETGIVTVALSGGCFQNRILSTRLSEMLRAERFEVLTNRLVPVNDGGISLGQAAIAGSVAGNNPNVI